MVTLFDEVLALTKITPSTCEIALLILKGLGTDLNNEFSTYAFAHFIYIM